MSQEVNKKSVKAARRNTRSKTQAIFFDKSSVPDKETKSTVPDPKPEASEAASLQRREERQMDEIPMHSSSIDGQKRMFSFSKLLGMFNHLENEASQKSYSGDMLKTDATCSSRVTDNVMEKKKIFESFARGGTASGGENGPCPPAEELFRPGKV